MSDGGADKLRRWESDAALRLCWAGCFNKLLNRFEDIAATERAWIDLDRTVHFDHLGINDSLAQVEYLWNNKHLAAPAQFVPLFNRITSHPSIMHLARERAAKLKDEFTAPPPQPAPVPAS